MRCSGPRALVAAAVLLGTVAGTSPARAGGIGPSSSAWWWRGHVEVAPLAAPGAPAPPTVPPGGLYVAAVTGDAFAVGALRYTLPAGGAAGRLSLDIADVTGVPSLRLCRATEAWTAVEGGSFEDRPSSDCTVSAAGVVEPEATVVFDAGPLAQGETVDVVIEPAPDANGVIVPFSVAFYPPGPESLAVTVVEPNESPPSEEPTPPVDPGGTGPGGIVVTTGEPPLGPLGGLIEPSGPPAAVGIPDAPLRSTAFSGPPRPAVPRSAPQRLFSVLVLLALGAWYLRLQGIRPRTPRLLAAVGTSRVPATGPRGVGRFVAPRQGRVPKL